MKKPKDINTPLTKRCKTWEELRAEGKVIDGILYLPSGVITGNLPIHKTVSYQNDKINKEIKQREFINIEKLKNHEQESNLTTDFSYNEDEENI